jgi:hypothetical protein
MTELASSMLLMGRDGVRRLICPEIMIAKIKLGIREAMKRDEIFHLWFHPSNFHFDTDRQFEILDSILAYAAACRKDGLRIGGMGDFS